MYEWVYTGEFVHSHMNLYRTCAIIYSVTLCGCEWVYTGEFVRSPRLECRMVCKYLTNKICEGDWAIYQSHTWPLESVRADSLSLLNLKSLEHRFDSHSLLSQAHCHGASSYARWRRKYLSSAPGHSCEVACILFRMIRDVRWSSTSTVGHPLAHLVGQSRR